MTSNVMAVLDKIKMSPLFAGELYFTGGTALSYYIRHRVSEDIDLVSDKVLEYKTIIPIMRKLGALKIDDENAFALRLAGLVPDEYMLKFILDGVKVEFFYANRPIQKEILQASSYAHYESSHLRILDKKSIAQLKVIAFFQREKSRDLFDVGAILENNIITLDEILSIANRLKSITTKEALLAFVANKKEPKDDEAVYLSEEKRLDMSFSEIKKQVMLVLDTL